MIYVDTPPELPSCILNQFYGTINICELIKKPVYFNRFSDHNVIRYERTY